MRAPLVDGCEFHQHSSGAIYYTLHAMFISQLLAACSCRVACQALRPCAHQKIWTSCLLTRSSQGDCYLLYVQPLRLFWKARVCSMVWKPPRILASRRSSAIRGEFESTQPSSVLENVTGRILLHPCSRTGALRGRNRFSVCAAVKPAKFDLSW